MKRIDTHQHFWHFDPIRDGWINEDMKAIRRDFLPGDLQPLLLQNQFEGCVAVQASESDTETDFLISLALQYKFIKGVVGWIDLQAPGIEEKLAGYKSTGIVKGFRHVLQNESQRDFMLQPGFRRGIAALQQHGFSYDILILPDQIQFSTELISMFPEQKFVLDHLAKPRIRHKDIDSWKQDIKRMGERQNVFCKVSGMVTEADWKNWKKQDFQPYLDVIVEVFGPDRMMFGSDWPVCNVAATYAEVVNIVDDYLSGFSENDREKIFRYNAISFYNL